MSDTPRGEITVRRTGYGVTIDRADDQVLISLEFIAGADTQLVEISGDFLTLRADNGPIYYRVIGWEPRSYSLIAEKVAR